jgi:RecA-family ATPase
MLTTDAEYVANDPDKLIRDVKEAFLDRNRIADISELEKLVNEPNDYRAKLADILRREQSVCPVEGTPNVESAEELNDAEVRPATSLVGDGLLNKEGLMWIHSKGGTGKTFLALQLAGALCANHRWLGFDTGDGYQRVLYLQGELDRPWWQKRSRALRNLVSAPLQNLQFCHERLTLVEWDHRHRLLVSKGMNILERLVELHQPSVVFIDPLAKFYSLDENSTDQNREFDNAIYDFRRKCHVTMVLVHHDRKPPPGDESKSVMRGSSVLQAGADSSVILRRTNEGREIWLDWDKVRHAFQPPPTQLLQRPDGFFQVVEDIDIAE